MPTLVRGAKSGGTGEPGSQKVNWPAESFSGYKKKLWEPLPQSCLQIIAVFANNETEHLVFVGLKYRL